ncbi:MAG: DUF72 domain-containing protein [Bacteroidetes bacterium]|nr:DUF72 domain-containing protein [Bacteroidota bacterium]
MHKYNIGCSGYYYQNWKNKFYPVKLQPKQWLEYYSSVFNTVELNGTFYRTPKLEDLKRYAAVTKDDFTFSAKMSKYISHIIKMKDSKESIDQFQELIFNGLEKKLDCFLFQLPPTFHYTEENLNRIIENVPHQPHNVIELRHISWWNEDVETAFKKANLTFCNVDYPGLKSHIISTSNLFYFRFHGNPELFKSAYTVEELRHFSNSFPNENKNQFVYFNNTYYEAGYTNAIQLIEIIKEKNA